MATYSFSQFIKRVTIHPRIPVEAIYNAWTTPRGLESWFLRSALYFDKNGKQKDQLENAMPGDRYHWLWHGYDDTIGEQRKVLDTNGKVFFQFEFSGGCIVSITIKKEGEETICELKQEMPMDDEGEQRFFFIECSTGWTFYLANLKSILEGGIDLRNKNVQIKSVINA